LSIEERREQRGEVERVEKRKKKKLRQGENKFF